MELTPEQRLRFYVPFKEKVRLVQLLKQVQSKFAQQNSLVMAEDLTNMKRVLRRLEFVDKSNIVLEKVRQKSPFLF